MGKGSSRQRRNPNSVKKSAKDNTNDHVFRDEDIDDEIDAFHKQRDVVPLDLDGDAADTDDEMEQSVFDLKVGDGDETSDDSRSSDDDKEDDDKDDRAPPKGYEAKIVRQAKYLKQKFGSIDDEINDDNSEEEEQNRVPWGRAKNRYYNSEKIDPENVSSDDELPKEEENEVKKIQKDKAKSLLMEDFGLEDDDQVDSDSDDQEKAFTNAFTRKKSLPKNNINVALVDDPFGCNEEVRKDLSTLSKDEQMEVVYSSAPELVGLLKELDKALNQLKQLKSLLPEASEEKKDDTGGVMNYMGVKHSLLLTYCQAIGFYLLLKSEGHSVRDHPVIARLVEIKNLMDKMEQLGLNVPSQIEDIVNRKTDSNINLAQKSLPVDSESNMTIPSAKPSKTLDLNESHKLVKNSFSEDFASVKASESLQVGSKSMEMLKKKADIVAKLKEKGIYDKKSILKPEKTHNDALMPANRRLETLDDFDDEVYLTGKRHLDNKSNLSKPSFLVSTKANKVKFVSGDDDLPKRDDVGERRRKYEQRVLSRTGASCGDAGDDMEDDIDGVRDTPLSPGVTALEDDGEKLESEDEFYEQAKKRRVDKVTAKAQLYTRTQLVPNPSLEIGEGDKRLITRQMEKNRGLTRNRKKEKKTPRVNIRRKHEKAVSRRKGQVRDVKKQTGPYGGELSGVNINVSRSRRFKG